MYYIAPLTSPAPHKKDPAMISSVCTPSPDDGDAGDERSTKARIGTEEKNDGEARARAQHDSPACDTRSVAAVIDARASHNYFFFLFSRATGDPSGHASHDETPSLMVYPGWGDPLSTMVDVLVLGPR